MSSETQVDVKLARVAGALSGALNEHAGDAGNQLAVRTDNVGVEIGTDNYIHQVRATVIVPGTTPFVGGSGLVSATDTHTLFADYPVGYYPLTLTYYADLSTLGGGPYTNDFGQAQNVPKEYGVVYRDLLSGMWGDPVDVVSAPAHLSTTDGYAISLPPNWLPDGYIDAVIVYRRPTSPIVSEQAWRPLPFVHILPFATPSSPLTGGLVWVGTDRFAYDSYTRALVQDGQGWSYSGSMQVGAPHLVASNVNLPSILGGAVTLTLPGLGTATTDKKQGHCRVYVTPHGIPDQQLPILLDTLSDGAAGASAKLSISRDWTNPFSIDMTDFLTATSGQADVYVFSDVVPYNYDIKVYHG